MNYYNTIEKKGYYLIAEIGVNYYEIAEKEKMSCMEAAKLMVRSAKEAGIDAVKFQTYKAEKIASCNSPSYWDRTKETTSSQYELFKKYDHFGYDEYKELSEYCRSMDIEFMSTPFDFEAADYLDPLMNIYKISSSDLTNIPFIEHIAKKNKPIILSTGASNIDEIERAVDTIRSLNKKPMALLHCVLEYPTPFEHANLNKIVSLKEMFKDAIIGYSDHTNATHDMDALKTAFILGATIIEKHFTLDKSLKGNDHYHAMDSADAKKVIDDFVFIKKIRGSYKLECLESESTARANARRSIVAAKLIRNGETIEKDMITFKRPGTGISPVDLDSVIGKKAVCDIEYDTILKSDMFE